MRKALSILLASCFGIVVAQDSDTTPKLEGRYQSAGVSQGSFYGQTQDDIRELAYGAFEAKEFDSAEMYFARICEMNSRTEEDILTYVRVLKINQKYELAMEQMELFNQLNPTDSRGLKHVANPKGLYELLSDNEQFSISNVAVNSANEDFGTSYMNDRIVFVSNRKGVRPIKRTWMSNGLPYLDMYVADVDAENQLSNVEPHVAKFNRKYHDGPAAFAENGTYKVITRNNYEDEDAEGQRKLKMFESRLENGKWTAPKGMSWNSSDYSAGHATITADGSKMYFVSDMPGGLGGVDVYSSKKDQDGQWTAPVNMGPTINTEGDEMFPFIHDSDMLIFASDGHMGIGGLDVFYTQLGASGMASPIQNMGVPINSNLDDFAMILDKDMGTGFFSSNREGGIGQDDIYAIDVLKPLPVLGILKGIATNEESAPIAGAVVSLTNENGEVVSKVVTDETGAYTFFVDKGEGYTIGAAREGYTMNPIPLVVHEEDKVTDASITLAPRPEFSLYGLVSDVREKTPIDDVTITLRDKSKQETQTFLTSAIGEFDFPLEGYDVQDAVSFNIGLAKEGYAPKNIDFDGLISEKGRVEVNASNDLALFKLRLEGGFEDGIMLYPIYFDVDNHEIRQESIEELQKIVDIMNAYPTIVIELGSHTDCRAHPGYNRRLSDQRAKASAAWIRARIENGERISGKGYGETQLVNDCACGFTDLDNQICTEDEHQMNRRTEFKIIKL